MYRYYMVDVVAGDDVRFVAGPTGELFSCDAPETHFLTPEEAEAAAQKCRALHPSVRVEVNGKLY